VVSEVSALPTEPEPSQEEKYEESDDSDSDGEKSDDDVFGEKFEIPAFLRKIR
jgi:hypothetical protein